MLGVFAAKRRQNAEAMLAQSIQEQSKAQGEEEKHTGKDEKEGDELDRLAKAHV